MGQVVTGVVTGPAGVSLLARLLGAAGTPVTRASLTSIGWSLADLTALAQLAAGTFAVATSVFDGLQTDPRWSADAVGYNFLATIPAASFTLAALAAGAPGAGAAPRRYQADVLFTPASGEVFRVPFLFTMAPSYG